MTLLFVRFLDHRSLASLGARAPLGGRRAALRQAVAAPLSALGVLGVWLALILALPAAYAAVHFEGISAGFSVFKALKRGASARSSLPKDRPPWRTPCRGRPAAPRATVQEPPKRRRIEEADGTGAGCCAAHRR